MGLALGFELVAQSGDRLILRGYERGAIRLQPVVWPVGIWSRPVGRLAGLIERVPELEAATPQEPSEAPETAAEPSEGREPQSSNEGRQEATQPRPRTPWWRRVLGR